MARPPVDEEASVDLGLRAAHALDHWVENNGEISYPRISAQIYSDAGVYIDRTSLHRLFTGRMDPNTVSIEVLLAVSQFLDISPDDLGPVVARRRRQVAMLALCYDETELERTTGLEPATLTLASCGHFSAYDLAELINTGWTHATDEFTYSAA